MAAFSNTAEWGNTYKGFSKALTEAGKILTKQGGTILTRACEDWLKEQDEQWPHSSVGTSYKSGYHGGDHYHPWYTGNLHDSIATRVADNNRTISIRLMEPRAVVRQGAIAADVGRDYDNIVGAAFGRMAAVRSGRLNFPGVQAILVVGVPYAEKVDEMDTHQGYIKEFERDFASTMEGALQYEFGRTYNLIIR